MLTRSLLVALLLVGACNKKGEEKNEKPADKAIATAPAAAGKLELPPACQEFRSLFDKLLACEKLGEGRASMKAGYERMFKSMSELGDAKAAADGCQQGLDGLKHALEIAKC